MDCKVYESIHRYTVQIFVKNHEKNYNAHYLCIIEAFCVMLCRGKGEPMSQLKVIPSLKQYLPPWVSLYYTLNIFLPIFDVVNAF